MTNMVKYHALNMISIITETYLLFRFSSSILNKRYGGRHLPPLYMLIAIALHFSIGMVELYTDTFEIIGLPRIIAAVAIDACLLSLLYSNKIIQKVFALLVFYAGITTIEYITITIAHWLVPGYTVAMSQDNTMMTITIALLIRITEFGLLMLFLDINRVRTSKKNSISGVVLSPMFSVITMWCFYPASWNLRNEVVNQLLVVIAVVILLNNIHLFIFYHEVNYQTNRSKQLAAAYQAQREQIQSQVESNKAVKKTAHDLRHHYNYLSSALENDEFHKALRYLHSLERRIAKIITEKITGNDEIDSILNVKVDEAKRHGILLEISGALPRAMPFEPVDISILLGNALENAIEATKQVGQENRRIEASFTYAQRRFSLKVTNPYKRRPEKAKGNTYYSTKHDGAGLGMEIMNEVVRKYDGTMLINLEDNMFGLTVFITGTIAE